VVSGHLSSPTINNGVVTEEKDGSVSWLERSVDLVLDGWMISFSVDGIVEKTYMGQHPFGTR
jgi:hypothetical protein